MPKPRWCAGFGHDEPFVSYKRNESISHFSLANYEATSVISPGINRPRPRLGRGLDYTITIPHQGLVVHD